MRHRLIGLWLLVTPILAYTFQIQAAYLYPTPSPSPSPTPPACSAGKIYQASTENCFFQADKLATAKAKLLYYQKKLDADEGNLNVDNKAIDTYTQSISKMNVAIASNEQLLGNIQTNKWCWDSNPGTPTPYKIFEPNGSNSIPGNWTVQEIASPLLKVTYNDRENLKRERQKFGSCTTYPEFQDVPADPIEYLNYQAVSQTLMGEYYYPGESLKTGIFVYAGTNPIGRENCDLENIINAGSLISVLNMQKDVRRTLEAQRVPWYAKHTADAQAATQDKAGRDTWEPEVLRWTISLDACQKILLPLPADKVCPCYYP